MSAVHPLVDRQLLYGLTVASTFKLHQDRPVGPEVAADVTIVDGPHMPHTEQTPTGEVLLDFGASPDRWYTAVRTPDAGYLMRVYSVCDMVITADLQHVRLHLVEGTDPGMRSVMATGALLAFLLYLRGQAVLHASAVQVGTAALGFMGYSGMGKSTLAALMCAEGARVITDDVLPITPGTVPRVRLGATGLRLRPGARELAADFAAGAARHQVSADERHVLIPQGDAPDQLPLAALLVPAPNRQGRLELQPLPQKDALLAILKFPRLMGWCDQRVQTDMFRHAAALAARLPVFIAHVPWGPPFRSDVTERIRECITDSPIMRLIPHAAAPPQPSLLIPTTSEGSS